MGAKKRAKKESAKETEETKEPENLLQIPEGEKGIVFQYMYDTNRPYSVQNVFDNLRGAVKKASLQKVMDTLTAEGRLQMKEFGKAKIYLVNQKLLQEASPEELQQIESEIRDLEDEERYNLNRIKELQTQHKELSSALCIEEIQK